MTRRRLFAMLAFPLALGAQPGATQEPEQAPPSPEQQERRRTIGLLPALDYSADKGFGYGVIFQYDDKRSPEYQPYYLSHRILVQRTTRGIADYKYRLDSKYLLPASLRLTVEARYNASRFEPYHGPGGAQTIFNNDFIAEDSPLYRGKHYYTYDKRTLLLNAVVQGPLGREDLRWLAGVAVLSTRVGTIDYSEYDEDPNLQSLLAHHQDIQGQDMGGGAENGVLLGLVWDRRDRETWPRRGLWTEVLARWVPSLPGNAFDYLAVTATHRQYLPLHDSLNLAFRISGRVMSEGAPFFSLSRLDSSFGTETAVGGNKTVRGILWQRGLGESFLYGNLELRCRVLSLFDTGYLAGSAFYDAGRTFDEAPPDDMVDRGEHSDRWHQGLGLGVRVALNDTFIVALDAAVPVDGSMDGPGLKLYVGLDWLF